MFTFYLGYSYKYSTFFFLSSLFYPDVIALVYYYEMLMLIHPIYEEE